jgi:hypothetical protein
MNILQKTTANNPVIRMALALSMMLGCLSAWSAPDQPVYTMIVIADAAHGHRIISGNYEQAVDKITSSRIRVDRFIKEINLCVAYTKSSELELAANDCDAALATLEDGRPARFAGSDLTSREIAYRRNLAVALSNRGVLRAVTGELELAREDFVTAMQLKTGLSAPKTNLARLEAAVESFS